jgi:hypothetical protein
MMSSWKKTYALTGAALYGAGAFIVYTYMKTNDHNHKQNATAAHTTYTNNTLSSSSMTNTTSSLSSSSPLSSPSPTSAVAVAIAPPHNESLSTNLTAAEEAGFTPKSEARSIFNDWSDRYDKVIGREETMMGLGSMRDELISTARGRVLEVASGTGRNVQYYDPQRIVSITFSDFSPDMLKQTRAKVMQRRQSSNAFRTIKVTLQESDAGMFPTCMLLILV